MAKARGAHGRGSVFLTGKGYWVAQISLGRDPVTGKRLRRTVSAASREDAQRELTALLFFRDRGVPIEPDGDRRPRRS